MQSTYEIHNPYKKEFPLRFHLDKLEKSEQVDSHWHESIELLYIKKGSCKINCNGLEIYLKDGDVILFSSFCPHHIVGGVNECLYYVITVSKSFCADFDIPINQPPFFIISEGGKPNDYYKQIIKLMKNQPYAYTLEAKAILLHIIIILYRKHSQEITDKYVAFDDEMIKKSIEYMSEHFAEPITIEEISRFAGVSKYYFCKKFKQTTGKTFIEFLNFLRCSNAKTLIRSRAYNINECARLSGFRNMSYFSRTYQKIMNKLPSEDR